jgi:hypothetical protein
MLAEAGRSAPSASGTVGVGNPALTKKMRVQYDKYNIDAQTGGEEPLKWAPWLEREGYGLDSQGNVYKKTENPPA